MHAEHTIANSGADTYWINRFASDKKYLVCGSIIYLMTFTNFISDFFTYNFPMNSN